MDILALGVLLREMCGGGRREAIPARFSQNVRHVVDCCAVGVEVGELLMMPGVVGEVEKLLSERENPTFFDDFGADPHGLPGVINHQITAYIKRVTTNRRLASYKGATVMVRGLGQASE
jgi:hypothetical protein